MFVYGYLNGAARILFPILDGQGTRAHEGGFPSMSEPQAGLRDWHNLNNIGEPSPPPQEYTTENFVSPHAIAQDVAHREAIFLGSYRRP